jgi:hypothetical protein
MESILTTIKKMLGIAEDYTHFDVDIIIHINSAFLALTQMGIGPDVGFSIKSSDDKWTDFIPENPRLEAIKTYIYLKVKLIFDPPTSSAFLEAMKRSIDEFEFRISIEPDMVLIDDGEEEEDVDL